MPAARNTIVFLTSDYSDYAKLAAEVLSTAAAAAGFGTLCITGRELAPESDARSEQAVCNGIYNLIKTMDVAGIICESGTLGHHAGPDSVIRFLEHLRLPCVSLGLDVPGKPSVIVDDALSMRLLMEHLVSDSECKRFSFVRGMPEDMYSMEREGIYREALVRHELEVDESLFVTGNYDVYESYDAVAKLLREHVGIDAIVCANDMMALSAARAATAAGLNIPRDIIVTGFDDVPDATRHSPALTTVRQPMAGMAKSAVAKLLALIDGAPVSALNDSYNEDRLTRVSSELIIRGSSFAAVKQTSNSTHIDAAELHRLLDAGMTGLKAPVESDLGSIAFALDHTLKHGSTSLAEHLTLIASQVSRADSHWWSNLCHQIEQISKGLVTPVNQTARLPFVQAALVCIRERVWALEMEREFAARRVERMRSTMQLRIGSSTGLHDTLKVIDSWIHASCPQRFFLVCYDEPSTEPRPNGRLICAYPNGLHKSVSDKIFPTRDILPDALSCELEQGSLLLNPVYAGTDHFGYLVIDPEGLDLSQIDSAARSIGNAMRSHYLIEALQSQAVRLQDANEELLTLANQDALTGLANRFCFEHHLRELCTSGGNGGRFAVCFLDLDGFKTVNDVHGHEIGDLLLRSISERLEHVVSDIAGDRGFVARLGGDEFTAVLDSPNLQEELECVLPALLASLSEKHHLAGQEMHVSASIGVATFPENGRDSSTLLKCADAAMYKAKALGKNRFVQYIEENDRLVQLQHQLPAA